MMDEKVNDANTMIIAEKLGKAFRIYDRKRDRLKQLVAGDRRSYYREHWAVRDISIHLQAGEALGVVGKNGSGKSTLLQLICGTLSPTTGNVQVNGKIAALLELGSGFNPEFTGRENVYLNASLLGLSVSETDKRLDNILAFADIGDFIDQPVRTYSSGMVVRLAFAVIANVDADILIIDEALAVGDAFFTQKCMRFIQRFRERGSLMFVSHDANAILSLCDQAILIEKGKLRAAGSPRRVIEQYTRDLQQSGGSNESLENTFCGESDKKSSNSDIGISRSSDNDRELSILQWSDYRTRAINSSELANKIQICRFKHELLKAETFGGKQAEIQSVALESYGSIGQQDIVNGGEVVKLQIQARANLTISNIIIGFILKNSKGLALLGDNTLNALPRLNERTVNAGRSIKAEFVFTLPMLPEGEYSVSASVAVGSQENHTILHWLNDALILRCQCTSIAAGLAGVAMHTIELERL